MGNPNPSLLVLDFSANSLAPVPYSARAQAFAYVCNGKRIEPPLKVRNAE
jgi:hypothetical protein